MGKITAVILLDFVARAQIAMNPAAMRVPIGMNPATAQIERQQFLAREIAVEEAALRRPMAPVQRREMLARLGATLAAAAVEGSVPQAATKASQWAVGQRATQAAKAMQHGQTAYKTVNGLTSGSPFGDGVKNPNQPSQKYPWDLEMFAKVSVAVVIVPVLLYFIANFLLVMAGVLYVAMMSVRNGFVAVYEMMISFTQEQGVMSRLCALNLAISPSASTVGSLHETLLNAKGLEAKVGRILSAKDVKQKQSRTIPASMFLNTEGYTKEGASRGPSKESTQASNSSLV